MKKICTKCKIEKDAANYYKQFAAKDGLQYKCKACVKVYQQAHKEEKAEYQKIYHKTYSQTESRRRIKAKYHQDHPEKITAHNVLNGAIHSGRMKRSIFCERCGLPVKTEGHHADYSKPFEVDWLCRKCHIHVHKE